MECQDRRADWGAGDTQNIQMNRGHYSSLAYLGASAVSPSASHSVHSYLLGCTT